MPTFTDRLRSVAGRAGRVLTAMATPAAPGFAPRGGARRPNPNSPQGKRLRSQEALFGRTSYGLGPSTARYSSNPATNLEPQEIWRLQLVRNQGYPQLWTELCEQLIERDGHLGGILDTRRQAVSECPFRVHPSQRGNPLAESMSGLVERMVDKIDSFDQVIEDLLTAAAYGYAISEIVWSWERIRFVLPNGKPASAVFRVPRTIEWVHWKHVRFDLDTDEPYLWYPEGEQAIPPHKYLFHAGAGTGLIERRGFMGSCAWLSAAKRWSERDWLIYAKLFGIPNVLGKYKDGDEEYEAHRDEYQQILQDFGEGIPALVPDDLVVEITREAAGRSSDIHGAIIGWANAEMSKRILGSTLTVEIGNQGAYAAADTHRDAPYRRSRSDSKKLCGTFRRQLYRAFIEVNLDLLEGLYGEPAEELLEVVPKSSFRIERETSPTERQKAYEGAVNELGLDVDEMEYRDEMGFDAPPPGGKALRGKVQIVSNGGAAIASNDVASSTKPITAPEQGQTQPAGRLSP